MRSPPSTSPPTSISAADPLRGHGQAALDRRKMAALHFSPVRPRDDVECVRADRHPPENATPDRGSAALAEKLALYSVPGPGGCRVWKSHKNLEKYAYLRWNGEVLLASRLAWVNIHGPIPKSKVVRQSCGHKGCIEVSHMFLGRKRGEGHPLVKLTEEDVRKILSIPRKERPSSSKLALDHGVSRRTINNVLTRKTWGHVHALSPAPGNAGPTAHRTQAALRRDRSSETAGHGRPLPAGKQAKRS